MFLVMKISTTPSDVVEIPECFLFSDLKNAVNKLEQLQFDIDYYQDESPAELLEIKLGE